MDTPRIELVDHVGTSPKGKRVEHNQWLVKESGRHIGYLSKQEGAKLSLISWVDEQTKAAIEQEVSRVRGSKVGGVVMIHEPADELPADNTDEEYEDLDFENEDF